jgi:ammonium transporter, Amt family
MATGLLGGVIAWVALNRVGPLTFIKHIDDTLGVWATHGVAGFVGGMCVGLFGNPYMIEYLSKDKKTPDVSAQGLFFGNPKQLWIQFLAALFIIVYDAIMTFVVLKIVSLVVPLRASDVEVEGGDLAIHGVEPMPTYFPPVGKQPTGSGA